MGTRLIRDLDKALINTRVLSTQPGQKIEAKTSPQKTLASIAWVLQEWQIKRSKSFIN